LPESPIINLAHAKGEDQARHVDQEPACATYIDVEVKDLTFMAVAVIRHDFVRS
jgi:hypothetical protein